MYISWDMTMNYHIEGHKIRDVIRVFIQYAYIAVILFWDFVTYVYMLIIKKIFWSIKKFKFQTITNKSRVHTKQ